MERTPLIIGLVLALLLAGCAPAPTASAPEPSVNGPTDTVDGTVPGANDEIREELLGEPSGDVDTGREILQGSLSSDVRDLIERGRGREATGYSYQYTRLDGTRLAAEDSNQATVYQKGATRHAVFFDDIQINANFFATGVLFDDAARTAELYCLDRRCDWSPGAAPVLKDVTYADYDFKTPSDWLGEVRNLRELGGETISGRSTMKLEGTIDGVDTLLWLDRYSGLPMQVQYEGSTYQYTRIVLGVSDDELAPGDE